MCPLCLFSLLPFAVSNWTGLMGSTNHFRSWMRYCLSHLILSHCIKHTSLSKNVLFFTVLAYCISLYRRCTCVQSDKAAKKRQAFCEITVPHLYVYTYHLVWLFVSMQSTVKLFTILYAMNYINSGQETMLGIKNRLSGNHCSGRRKDWFIKEVESHKDFWA